MDLRGELPAAQVERACEVLNYQPFIITDDIQTGAAYSWIFADRYIASFVFRRAEQSVAEWDRICHCGTMQRQTYDTFLRAIADHYPGGTLLDVACNNGYFPVGAERLGMGRSTGTDVGAPYGESLAF